jgi:alpha-galactosidase
MRGVVAPDATEGLYTIITPPTTADTRSRVRFPGLDDGRRYRLTVSQPESLGPPWQVGEWLRDAPTIASEIDEPDAGTVYSGSMLSAVGLEFPTFHPDRAAVVHLRAVD